MTDKIDADLDARVLAMLAQEALGCRSALDLKTLSPYHPADVYRSLRRLVLSEQILHLGGRYSDDQSVFQLADRAASGALMGRDSHMPLAGHLRSLAHIIGDARNIGKGKRGDHSTGQEHPDHRGAVRATCGCSWKGPWRAVFEMTEHDATAHRVVMEGPCERNNLPGGIVGAADWISTANGNDVHEERYARECSRREAREAAEETRLHAQESARKRYAAQDAARDLQDAIAAASANSQNTLTRLWRRLIPATAS